MSQLIDFYRGTATDSQGRTLDEILSWSDGRFEAIHDFIQWLFPLPEPSRFNAAAPLLTAEDIAAFRADDNLRAKLARSFHRFLAFLGLSLTAAGTVVESGNFAARVPDAWESPNHNWLRVTRVLRSLTLLGLGEQARSLYSWLETSYKKVRFPIPPDTFQYWTEAIKDDDAG